MLKVDQLAAQTFPSIQTSWKEKITSGIRCVTSVVDRDVRVFDDQRSHVNTINREKLPAVPHVAPRIIPLNDKKGDADLEKLRLDERYESERSEGRSQ